MYNQTPASNPILVSNAKPLLTDSSNPDTPASNPILVSNANPFLSDSSDPDTSDSDHAAPNSEHAYANPPSANPTACTNDNPTSDLPNPDHFSQLGSPMSAMLYARMAMLDEKLKPTTSTTTTTTTTTTSQTASNSAAPTYESEDLTWLLTALNIPLDGDNDVATDGIKNVDKPESDANKISSVKNGAILHSIAGILGDTEEDRLTQLDGNLSESEVKKAARSRTKTCSATATSSQVEDNKENITNNAKVSQCYNDLQMKK